MELTKNQEIGIRIAVERYKNKEKFVTIAGYAGTGKAQPIDTVVPTFNGFKRLGDLKIGDELYDKQGERTKVLGIYPQGLLDEYEIILEDGRRTYCNEEHLWEFYCGEYRQVDTLKEMMRLKYNDIDSKGVKRNNKIRIPSLAFAVKKPIDNKNDKSNAKLKRYVEQYTDSDFDYLIIPDDEFDNFKDLIWGMGLYFSYKKVDEGYCIKYITKKKTLEVVDIKKTGRKKEMVCIYVDNFEHLYLTNDYIVTHNTTLVKYIVDELKDKFNLEDTDFCYCSYTGRAVQVLMNNGNKNAKTLHKLLYDYIPLPEGGFVKIPYENLKYKVIIIDEVSMIPKEMISLLLSYDIYCIFCGDPGQLGVIKDKENENTKNDLLEHPHVFLDEVMRQAKESEIIRLTMDIREGKRIVPFNGKEVIVIGKKDLNTGMLTWADQIICAKNVTRININNQIRSINGFSSEELPHDGEKVVCLTNYWDCYSTYGDPLINGTIGLLKDPIKSFIRIPYYISGRKIDVIRGKIISKERSNEEDNIFEDIIMDLSLFYSSNKSLEWKEQYKMSKSKRTIPLIPKEITFGYTITGWKAQGSQFDKVLAIEENFPYDREEHKRYLYTICTRAIEKLVLVINK